uniref:Triacylglycerol lipase n=1 Tax=Timema tahoe TaxID=61484 RepID=A0A7R9IQY9_9NEOP|nr:unnamed protein product [Timema tahoe]
MTSSGKPIAGGREGEANSQSASGSKVKGKFREFDNRPQLLPIGLRLGNVEPLDYPLHMITAPVVLLYASNDWMSDIRDVSRLASSLPNVIDTYLVPQSTFNHLDFMYGIHSNTLVYDRIFSILNPNSRLRGAGSHSTTSTIEFGLWKTGAGTGGEWEWHW